MDTETHIHSDHIAVLLLQTDLQVLSKL